LGDVDSQLVELRGAERRPFHEAKRVYHLHHPVAIVGRRRAKRARATARENLADPLSIELRKTVPREVVWLITKIDGTKNGTGPVLEGWAVSFIIYLANTGPVPLAPPFRDSMHLGLASYS
jgi:hypothetical protein